MHLLSSNPANDAGAAGLATALGLLVFFFCGKAQRTDSYLALSQGIEEKSGD
jgi:hypothetical protein